MQKITCKKAATKAKIKAVLKGKNLTSNTGLLPVLRFIKKLSLVKDTDSLAKTWTPEDQTRESAFPWQLSV